MLCGVEHAKMLLRVYVDTPEEFEAWIQRQRRPAQTSSAAAEGRRIFETNSCINCHTVAGTAANGRFGPDLTHLMSRATIASGSLKNNADNLKKWVGNPDQFKPGVLMPSMHLSQPELEKITVYLTSLK
jgi:cytochrome c oxidase subunit 2